MWKLGGRIGNQMFQYAYLYSQAKRGEIPDIYVQDLEYFKDYLMEIKSIFRQGIPEKMDMVAIHVRRGDYAGNPFYVDLAEETSYYEDAMDLFPPDTKFVVFSDDIEWCKRRNIFKDCEFSHGTEIEDMNNMASCVGQIIANSSFSWWGAFISPYSKKVIAPSVDHWYSDGEDRTKCPDSWIRL